MLNGFFTGVTLTPDNDLKDRSNSVKLSSNALESISGIDNTKYSLSHF